MALTTGKLPPALQKIMAPPKSISIPTPTSNAKSIAAPTTTSTTKPTTTAALPAILQQPKTPTTQKEWQKYLQDQPSKTPAPTQPQTKIPVAPTPSRGGGGGGGGGGSPAPVSTTPTVTPSVPTAGGGGGPAIIAPVITTTTKPEPTSPAAMTIRTQNIPQVKQPDIKPSPDLVKVPSWSKEQIAKDPLKGWAPVYSEGQIQGFKKGEIFVPAEAAINPLTKHYEPGRVELKGEQKVGSSSTQRYTIPSGELVVKTNTTDRGRDVTYTVEQKDKTLTYTSHLAPVGRDYKDEFSKAVERYTKDLTQNSTSSEVDAAIKKAQDYVLELSSKEGTLLKFEKTGVPSDSTSAASITDKNKLEQYFESIKPKSATALFPAEELPTSSSVKPIVYAPGEEPAFGQKFKGTPERLAELQKEFGMTRDIQLTPQQEKQFKEWGIIPGRPSQTPFLDTISDSLKLVSMTPDIISSAVIATATPVAAGVSKYVKQEYPSIIEQTIKTVAPPGLIPVAYGIGAGVSAGYKGLQTIAPQFKEVPAISWSIIDPIIGPTLQRTGENLGLLQRKPAGSSIMPAKYTLSGNEIYINTGNQQYAPTGIKVSPQVVSSYNQFIMGGSKAVDVIDALTFDVIQDTPHPENKWWTDIIREPFEKRLTPIFETYKLAKKAAPYVVESAFETGKIGAGLYFKSQQKLDEAKLKLAGTVLEAGKIGAGLYFGAKQRIDETKMKVGEAAFGAGQIGAGLFSGLQVSLAKGEKKIAEDYIFPTVKTGAGLYFGAQQKLDEAKMKMGEAAFGAGQIGAGLFSGLQVSLAKGEKKFAEDYVVPAAGLYFGARQRIDEIKNRFVTDIFIPATKEKIKEKLTPLFITYKAAERVTEKAAPYIKLGIEEGVRQKIKEIKAPFEIGLGVAEKVKPYVGPAISLGVTSNIGSYWLSTQATKAAIKYAGPTIIEGALYPYKQLYKGTVAPFEISYDIIKTGIKLAEKAKPYAGAAISLGFTTDAMKYKLLEEAAKKAAPYAKETGRLLYTFSGAKSIKEGIDFISPYVGKEITFDLGEIPKTYRLVETVAEKVAKRISPNIAGVAEQFAFFPKTREAIKEYGPKVPMIVAGGLMIAGKSFKEMSQEFEYIATKLPAAIIPIAIEEGQKGLAKGIGTLRAGTEDFERKYAGFGAKDFYITTENPYGYKATEEYKFKPSSFFESETGGTWVKVPTTKEEKKAVVEQYTAESLSGIRFIEKVAPLFYAPLALIPAARIIPPAFKTATEEGITPAWQKYGYDIVGLGAAVSPATSVVGKGIKTWMTLSTTEPGIAANIKLSQKLRAEIEKENELKFAAQELEIYKTQLQSQFDVQYAADITTGKITYEEAKDKYMASEGYKKIEKEFNSKANELQGTKSGWKIARAQFIDYFLTPETPGEVLRTGLTAASVLKPTWLKPIYEFKLASLAGRTVNIGDIASLGFGGVGLAAGGKIALTKELPKETRIAGGVIAGLGAIGVIAGAKGILQKPLPLEGTSTKGKRIGIDTTASLEPPKAKVQTKVLGTQARDKYYKQMEREGLVVKNFAKISDAKAYISNAKMEDGTIRKFVFFEKGRLIGGKERTAYDLSGNRLFSGFEIIKGKYVKVFDATSVEQATEQITRISTMGTYQPTQIKEPGFFRKLLGMEGKEEKGPLVQYRVEEEITPLKTTKFKAGQGKMQVKIITQARGKEIQMVINTKAREQTFVTLGKAKTSELKIIKTGEGVKYAYPINTKGSKIPGDIFDIDRFTQAYNKGKSPTETLSSVKYTPRKITFNIKSGKIEMIGEVSGDALSTAMKTKYGKAYYPKTAQVRIYDVISPAERNAINKVLTKSYVQKAVAEAVIKASTAKTPTSKVTVPIKKGEIDEWGTNWIFTDKRGQADLSRFPKIEAKIEKLSSILRTPEERSKIIEESFKISKQAFKESTVTKAKPGLFGDKRGMADSTSAASTIAKSLSNAYTKLDVALGGILPGGAPLGRTSIKYYEDVTKVLNAPVPKEYAKYIEALRADKKGMSALNRPTALRTPQTPLSVGGGTESAGGVIDFFPSLLQTKLPTEALRLRPSMGTVTELTNIALMPLPAVSTTSLLGVSALAGSVGLALSIRPLTRNLSLTQVYATSLTETLNLQKIGQTAITQPALAQTPATGTTQRTGTGLITITEPVTEPVEISRPIGPGQITIPRPTVTEIGRGFFILPEDETPKKRKPFAEPVKKKKSKGSAVLIRRRGKYLPLSSTMRYSVPESEAFALGARAVLGGSAATFKIIPSEKPMRTTGVTIAPGTKSLFRLPKSGEPGVFIQRKEVRIKSPGEISEITRVGIARRLNLSKRSMRLMKRRMPIMSSMRSSIASSRSSPLFKRTKSKGVKFL